MDDDRSSSRRSAGEAGRTPGGTVEPTKSPGTASTRRAPRDAIGMNLQGPAGTAAPEAAAASTPTKSAATRPRKTSAISVDQATHLARLEDALRDRYLIRHAPVTVADVTVGQTEYRFRGDSTRIAFTESSFRLATDTNSPSVARSMVDVAEARRWTALRVSGHEDFRRLVWLEASVRGVRLLGYEPTVADQALLQRERDARQVNRIEPARDAATAAAATADKPTGRGSGGRKAVLAAIEAVLVARRVPEKQRQAVMAAATEQLAQRIRTGQVPKVKVYDPAAPSRRPAVTPSLEPLRSRERPAPAPVR